MPRNFYIVLLGYPELQISGVPYFRIFGFPDILNSGHLEIRTSEIPEIQNFGNPENRKSGYLDFRKYGFTDVQIDVRNSGVSEFRMPVCPEVPNLQAAASAADPFTPDALIL